MIAYLRSQSLSVKQCVNYDKDTLFSLHLHKPTDKQKIMPFELLLLRSLIDQQHSFIMPKSSAEESARVIGHLQAGVNPKQVLNLFDVHISTVYRLKEKFEQDNTVKRIVGSGRPRKTSLEADAQLVEAHDRFRIPEETCLDFNVSEELTQKNCEPSTEVVRFES